MVQSSGIKPESLTHFGEIKLEALKAYNGDFDYFLHETLGVGGHGESWELRDSLVAPKKSIDN